MYTNQTENLHSQGSAPATVFVEREPNSKRYWRINTIDAIVMTLDWQPMYCPEAKAEWAKQKKILDDARAFEKKVLARHDRIYGGRRAEAPPVQKNKFVPYEKSNFNW